jgi:uncharacterized protein YkwD
MKKYLIAGIIILAIATCGLLLLPNNKPQAQPKVDNRPIATTAPVATPTPAELLALTNQARAENGLAPITLDERLNTSAQRKADDQVKYGYTGHVSPNDGRHGYEYVTDIYPSCPRPGENLTKNIYVNDSGHAFDAWMKSPAHRSALLNPYNLAIGFGVSGNEVVAHFCTSQ